MSDTEETWKIVQGLARGIYTDDRCHPILASRAKLIEKLALERLKELPEHTDDLSQEGG